VADPPDSSRSGTTAANGIEAHGVSGGAVEDTAEGVCNGLDAFAGRPSPITTIQVRVLRVVTAVTRVLGIDLGTQIAPLIAVARPPFFTRRGLSVQRGEFAGAPVYTIGSGNPSGKYVVALHGGAYVVQPTINHWLAYAAIARDTGASVVVPIYPLATTPAGRADTVIPAIADLIAAHIARHGAANVSVYGDSAGGGMALAAVQLLVSRGAETPSHMVLISPWLDVTMSNPVIASIDDPVLNPVALKDAGSRWAGDLDPTHPLVSPLYGALEGLPPTAVYSGSLDVLCPDVLVLQNKVLALGDAADTFTFVLRNGQIHDWAVGGLPLSPESVAVQPDIYAQLGLGSGPSSPGKANTR
jgi:triacylglycerol lipase